MAKHTKKNTTTGRSQGGPSRKTGQAAKKKTSSAVTRSPGSHQKLTDSTARIPTRSSTQGNASQTSLTTSRKRKTTEPTSQRTGKRQKTHPLTTKYIPTIVRAVRDTLPEPNETREDIQDTEATYHKLP